jgi:hypothetical protein
MHTNFKQLLRKYRQQPDELLTALFTVTHDELVRGVVELLTTGVLRLSARDGRKSLCDRYYELDGANPWIKFWFLQAARKERDAGRSHYSISILLEKLRHDVSKGIVKVDAFRIGNDMQSVYVRVILMLDPNLCGFFQLRKHTDADELVVNGRTWASFAKEHKAELWPEQTANKQAELPLGETA